MAAVAQFECPVAQELQTQAEKLWTTRVEIRLGIDPIVS